MNIFYVLKLALASIFSNKLRSILTISGIALCVAITVFMISVNSGLQKVIASELSRPEFSNLITASPKASDATLNEALISRLKSMNNISRVEYAANLSGKLNYGGSSVSTPIYALSEDYFTLAPVTYIAGENFDLSKDSKQIILNLKAADNLGIKNFSEVIGRNINVDLFVPNSLASEQKEVIKSYLGTEYQIVGIINKGDSPLTYVTMESVSGLGVKNYSQARILSTSYEKTMLTKESIEQLGFSVYTSKDTIKQFDKIFSLFKFILAVFVLLTLIVSVFGTINTISLSLVEKTREIGFLRLIGIREKDVKYLFIVESMILIFSGSILGIMISYILVFFGNSWAQMAVEPVILNVDRIFGMPYLAISIILTVSLILGWLTGIKPAKRAVKIEPLTALRF